VRHAIGALTFMLALAVPAGVRADATHAPHAGMAMTDAAMKQAVDNWFATHPRVGGTTKANHTADAVVRVTGFRFDADNNAGTQIDTVKISTGESVEWDWVDGSHTVTNGTGGADPAAGTIFDAASNSLNPTFVVTFETVGTFPYFCRVHEFFNMKGVVVVSSPTGVSPVPGGGSAPGFTRAPAPNPTRHGVDFEFALRTAGRARVEVFDLHGARVATVTDGMLQPGRYAGRWDGKRSDGRAVEPGAYWMRMTVPGATQSRRVVVER
jgi:plastocyanin